jgi:hypothetical protein
MVYEESAMDGQATLMDCQGPMNPGKKEVVRVQYTDEYGKGKYAFFNNINGCPIQVGLPNDIEYNYQVGLVTRKQMNFNSNFEKVDPNKWKMYPRDKWVPGTTVWPNDARPPPISCRRTSLLDDDCPYSQCRVHDEFGGCTYCEAPATYECGQYSVNEEVGKGWCNGYDTGCVVNTGPPP